MNDDTLHAMTGMASGRKPTHRGKRSRGKGAKPKSAQQHAAAITTAMQAGDHGAAKLSALHLAKALHTAQQRAKQPSTLPPDVSSSGNLL